MSHSVTITRTTTTTSTSAIIVNTGYLKTLPGLLKLAQLVLGAVCVGIVSYYVSRYSSNISNQIPELFFLLMSVTFLIGTFCLLTSCLISIATSTIISKSIYEVVYHGIASILYFAAALTLLIEVNHKKYQYNYDPYLAASIIGLIVTGLYLFSTVLATRTYRGI